MSDYELKLKQKLVELRYDAYQFYNARSNNEDVLWEHYHKVESFIQDVKNSQTQSRKIHTNKSKKNNTQLKSKSKSNLCQEVPTINDRALELMLDDILIVLSVSIDRNNHPTTQLYKLSIIKRLLDQIKKNKIYDTETIIKIKLNLNKIKIIIDNTKVKKKDVIFPLVLSKYLICEEILTLLETTINNEILNIDNTLLPFLDSLLSLKKRIINLPSILMYAASHKKNQNLNLLQTTEEKTRLMSSENEFISLETTLKNLNEEIASIYDGLHGESLIYSLSIECKTLFDDFRATNYNYKELMDDTLKPFYEQLVQVKYFWDLSLITFPTGKWMNKGITNRLNENSKILHKIHTLRSNGIFADKAGKPLKGQSTLIYLIDRCTSLSSKFLESYEPISGSLMATYEQLVKTRKYLTGLKRSSAIMTLETSTVCAEKMGEFYQKLDNGKFMADDGSLLIGQTSLYNIFCECACIYQDLSSKVK